MEDNNIIKSIVPHICPHCNKDFFIELQTIPTMVSGTLTHKDVKEAKEDALRKVADLNIDFKDTDEAIQWIRNEETIFGPSDVDSVVENIKKQYEIKN